MSSKTALAIAAGLAGSVLAVAAAAHPGGGGGGGFGGMGGGGMGGLGGMGAGGMRGMGDVAHGFGTPAPRASNSADARGMDRGMDRGTDHGMDRSSLDTHSATAKLENRHVDASLTKALTRRGIDLPRGGLKAACGGFRSLGQCVAALHVAHNLDLRGGFPALKRLTTGPDSIKLGKAIKELRPRADARAEERRADRQAERDLDAAGERGV